MTTGLGFGRVRALEMYSVSFKRTAQHCPRNAPWTDGRTPACLTSLARVSLFPPPAAPGAAVLLSGSVSPTALDSADKGRQPVSVSLRLAYVTQRGGLQARSSGHRWQEVLGLLGSAIPQCVCFLLASPANGHSGGFHAWPSGMTLP